MKKSAKILVAVLCLMMLMSSLSVFAASAPYQTYTYSMDGEPMDSPHAYVPERTISNFDMGLATPLQAAKDLFVDDAGNVYISDTGNKRVIVLDSNFKYQYEITTFINEHGVPDELLTPQGLFVDDKNIYISDSDNSRIVVFDLVGNFERIVEAPEADVMGEDTLFHPVALSVDASGKMYVVSDQTYSGVFALEADGSFICFIGAQKADVPLAVRIRRLIFPDVVAEEYITSAYNNIAIDEDGFVYVTTNDIDTETLATAIQAGNEAYAPVKRLNNQGVDIMRRNGFFIPAGEIAFEGTGTAASTTSSTGPSSLIDVALGPNGMWSVIDSKRCRIYTYDSDGNLLFAFGDKGSQLGNLNQPTAIDYKGSSILVLDATLNSITVYKREPYGDIIDQALAHTATRQYSEALSDWEDINRSNLNFDAAYVGIGTNLYRNGEFSASLDYFKAAGDVNSYSDSFKAIRKAWVEDWVLVVIIVIVVICIALSKFLGYVGKKNKEGVTKVGKRTLWEEFIYGFYLIMHPFDAYWDLKHEKRGSVRAAILIDGVVVVSTIIYSQCSAYIFNPSQGTTNPFASIMNGVLTVFAPLMLWCVANWCLTTLFDGEGNFKDIFISTSYALFPLSLLLIPITLCTHIATLDESSMISLVMSIAFIWVGMLIFFGMATTHGYSMGKNVIITVATIIGMMFIMFIMMLFTNLVQQMIAFVTDIISEISFRAN
ncbi:MAG: YIP1 family protein [Clostridia bacterium]|nr:YIP1 family protein [Clostridia bacterium]